MGDLPTAFGVLTMSARQQDGTLRVTLAPGLRATTQLAVAWPSRIRPARVTIDGKAYDNYSTDGIEIDKPFRELIAQW